jgi:S1-C subfamily serine protease
MQNKSLKYLAWTLVAVMAFVYALWLARSTAASASEAVGNYYIDPTVYITGKGEEKFGSGIVIGKNHILTAKHVVKSVGSDMRVATNAGGTYRVNEIELSRTTDVALLTLSADIDVQPVPYSCRLPELMEPLIKVGNPMGLRNILSKLTVVGSQSKKNEMHTAPVILVEGTINGGDSGGPDFDKNGKVVAITSAGYFIEMPNPKGLPDLAKSGIEILVPLSVVPELCKKESVKS